MTVRRPNPEWSKREIAARAVIGFVAGFAGNEASDLLWPWTRDASDKFLLDRLVFTAASTVVVLLLLHVWLRRLARADVVAAVCSSSLALWLFAIPFGVLRAAVKPTAPDLWASLFGNEATTLAYAPIFGLSVGVALVFAVPLARDWIGSVIGEVRRWAIRPRA
jgi:hypothetical protein